MKKSSRREGVAQIEAEAEGAAKSGLETVAQVRKKPIRWTPEVSIVCQRSNRHLTEAEAEAEKGQGSQLTTIVIKIANDVIDETNILTGWNSVKHVEKDTQEGIGSVCF